MGDSAQNARAVTFAVIGSVVFFLTTIVLAVCAVRICNKRKRKKIEKCEFLGFLDDFNF